MNDTLLSLENWILMPSVFLVGFLLIVMGFKKARIPASWIGIILGTAAIIYMVHIIESERAETKQVALVPPSSEIKAIRALALRKVSGGEQPPAVVSLATPGLSLPQLVADSSTSGRWLVLKADAGIAPEYEEWIQGRFGKITDAGHSTSQSLCWRRTSLFPYSSAECVNRLVRYTLARSPNDLTRTAGGESTVKAIVIQSLPVALVTHSLVQEVAPEETCLLALSEGRSCMALETLPAATMAGLSFKTDDPVLSRVLLEFGVPMVAKTAPQEALVSDLSFRETKVPSAPDPDFCGGLQTASGELISPELKETSLLIQASGSISALMAPVAELQSLTHCASLSTLRIDHLEMKKNIEGMRSIVSLLSENPFWFTTARDFVRRATKISSIRVGQDAQKNLWLDVPSKVDTLGLTFISPKPFVDQVIKETALSESRAGYSAFRLSPSSFRLNIHEAKGVIGIQNESLFMDPSRIRAPSFMDTPGVSRTILIAFVFGAGLSLVPALISAGQAHIAGFFPGVFFPVFSIMYLLIWTSLYAAGGSQARARSISSRERVSLPSYFFLREWPESWLSTRLSQNQGAPSEAGSGGDAVSSDPWKRWGTALEKARKDSAGKEPGEELVTLGLESISTAIDHGKGRILLWDEDGVRNWYFRRSPVYASALTGWSVLLSEGKYSYSSGEGRSLQQRLDSQTQILILPDAGHLSPESVTEVALWVRKGGKVLFSEKLDNNEGAMNSISSQSETASRGQLRESLLEAFQRAGLDHSQPSAYSVVTFADGTSGELRMPHRLPGSKSIPFGKGSITFLGVTPADQVSRQVADGVLRTVMGERIMIRDLGGAHCQTALLLEPFGMPMGELQKTADHWESLGWKVQWWVDLNSFAKMIPIWGPEFAKRGVVFRDEGSSEGRVAAARLWSEFNKNSDPLVFVTLNQPTPKSQRGPKGFLLQARTLPSPSGPAWERAVNDWRGECRFQVSLPRYIDPNNLKSHASAWGNAFSKLSDIRAVRIKELVDGIRTLSDTPSAEIGRKTLPVRSIVIPIKFNGSTGAQPDLEEMK